MVVVLIIAITITLNKESWIMMIRFYKSNGNGNNNNNRSTLLPISKIKITIMLLKATKSKRSSRSTIPLLSRLPIPRCQPSVIRSRYQLPLSGAMTSLLFLPGVFEAHNKKRYCLEFLA